MALFQFRRQWNHNLSLETDRQAMIALQASTSYGVGISSVAASPRPRLRRRRVILAKGAISAFLTLDSMMHIYNTTKLLILIRVRLGVYFN